MRTAYLDSRPARCAKLLGPRDREQTLIMKTLTALLLALWFSSAALLSAAPFRLSYSIVGPPVAGVWMTYETGAFKRYGLDVQLVYIPSSVTNIQALLGGSLDVAVPGISGVVLAAARANRQ